MQSAVFFTEARSPQRPSATVVLSSRDSAMWASNCREYRSSSPCSEGLASPDLECPWTNPGSAAWVLRCHECPSSTPYSGVSASRCREYPLSTRYSGASAWRYRGYSSSIHHYRALASHYRTGEVPWGESTLTVENCYRIGWAGLQGGWKTHPPPGQSHPAAGTRKQP